MGGRTASLRQLVLYSKILSKPIKEVPSIPIKIKFKKCNLKRFLFMCLCVSVCHYVCVCPEKPKEGARSPGTALTGGCEPYNVGAEN